MQYRCQRINHILDDFPHPARKNDDKHCLVLQLRVDTHAFSIWCPKSWRWSLKQADFKASDNYFDLACPGPVILYTALSSSGPSFKLFDWWCLLLVSAPARETIKWSAPEAFLRDPHISLAYLVALYGIWSYQQWHKHQQGMKALHSSTFDSKICMNPNLLGLSFLLPAQIWNDQQYKHRWTPCVWLYWHVIMRIMRILQRFSTTRGCKRRKFSFTIRFVQILNARS